MANLVRKNAWSNGGDFSNLDLFWYAKGVAKMKSRPLNDPASWWFYAAIHGEYVTPANDLGELPGWKYITELPPQATQPLASPADQTTYWDQCQHGTWYFLPWHRGYLLALEKQLQADIAAAGGPADWALPYWNYFGGTNGSQYQLPPAFAAQSFDGGPNPLFAEMRYGPRNNGDVFVPTPAAAAGLRPVVTLRCMSEPLYSGDQLRPRFGGPVTGFNHLNRSKHGDMESNPHDQTHGYVGGASGQVGGMMSDPNTAALDPIFYLHHCNIDRLWAVWNITMGNANPTVAGWVNGPAQRFAMPGAAGQPWFYTPGQMVDISALGYSYEEMQAPSSPSAPLLARRMMALGAPAPAAAAMAAAPAPPQPKVQELVGASTELIRLTGSGTAASVKLDAAARQKTVASLAAAAAPAAAAASEPALPDTVVLSLDNVRGTFDPAIVNVFVQAPGGTDRISAGAVALFGLRQASRVDGPHGGEGLSFALDISNAVDELHLSEAFDVDTLRVSLEPHQPLPEGVEITVGSIAVHRQGF